ncbi:membrane protein insertase YidC [Pseudonocardia endophytica]|uniref:Membrane protein insertase YidC n=1 Tax=Pseudonocardia endophytica TaxID=401976 RepID=A0A4V2PIT1_PSEEN|nr:membrane protein insertase YidC [Pseudonocardia endophytica]TCK25856.1 YidC/Oxa1 family membrane protein insertase [Pseudonocardia endophytica]
MLDVLYYPVSFVMRAWHALFADVLGPSSGTAWALSVVLLVLTVRALLVRSAWTRMRAARVTRALGPQLTRLRERHAGDPRRLAAETAALHRAHGVSATAGLAPMLLQIPVFVALLHVLRSFNRPGLGFAENAALPNYAFAPDEVGSFLRARLFGAPLSAWPTMPADQLAAFGPVSATAVTVVAGVLAVLAAVATHLSLRLSRRDQLDQPGAMGRLLAVLPWVAPVGVLVGGLLFPVPVALLVYWLAGAVATLVQQVVLQWLLDRRPAPVVTPVRRASAPRPGAKPLRARR